MPWLIRRFRLYDYDLIVSARHAVAKGARTKPFVPHLCFLHAPMRYMWDGFEEYFAPGRASLPVRLAAHLLRPWLRSWDRRSAAGVHRFFVNSAHIQAQVKRCYGRGAEILYAPVQLERFAPASQRGDYYLMVGAFAPNKRVHHAVEAFTRLGRPLKIVGTGQDEARCRALAGPSIEFLGERGDAEIAALYAGATGFVFPGVDDFGITPLEAQASGTPAIALAQGGALETVTPETGLLYSPRTGQSPVEALVEAVRTFEAERSRFTEAACMANARRFGREVFKARVTAAFEETWAAYQEGGIASLAKWR
jgi:glycosyltransferase involved in cell wall biosynthesis